MDFLSSMFSGIGDTFTAGSNVHMSLIGERNLKQQLGFEREALGTQTQLGALGFIQANKQQQTQMVIIIIMGVIALLAVMLIFRKKKA